MIVDSSAVVAIVEDEPAAAACAQAIEGAAVRRISAANFLEAAIVVDSRRNPVASRRLDGLLAEADFVIEPVTAEQVISLLRQSPGATPEPGGLDPTRFGPGPFLTVHSAGVTSWVELDLAPGTYVALCFVPGRDGTIHALKGMVDVLTVS